MKGFLSGVFWGAVLSIAGLVILSQTAPMPGVDAAAPPGPEAPSDPAVQAVPVSDEASASAAQADASEGGAEPAAEPVEPVSAEVAPSVELPAGSEFNRALPDEDPTLPETTSAPAPTATPTVAVPDQGGAQPATDTGPALLPAPDPVTPSAAIAPDGDGPANAALPQPDVIRPQQTAPSPEAPEPEPEPGSVDLPPPPPLTPDEQALAAAGSPALTETPSVPETATLPLDPVLTPVQPLPDAQGMPITASGAAGESGPTADGPDPAQGVVTGRLPRIGDPPDPAADPAMDPGLRDPIDRYARPFANPQGKPLFAIVLIDDGDAGLDRQKLAAAPFPITFVLDPTLPDVARLAEVYRDAGQEVAMLASAIPAGATAADLEVTFAAHAAALPQAVAVLDLAEGGFQGNRPLATQVVPIVKSQGRGLLTYDAGLNAADQVARREQLRAGIIFRRIDPDGQSAEDTRRTLDRAAFKAAQDGRVAVIGAATPSTVAALLEWTMEGRAASVTLAPATAVMIAR